MNHETGVILSGLTAYLFVILLLFLIGRHLVCWYWKINRGIDLLERINLNLLEVNKQLEKMNPIKPAPPFDEPRWKP